MVGVERDGAIHFEATRDRLSTYYIPHRDVSYVAEWHTDGKVEINASIKPDGELTYTYKFHNYLRYESELAVVFDETRRLMIDMEEVEDSYEYFDGGDGELLESNTNNDDWINRNGITLDDCKLEYDEESEEEFEQPNVETRRRGLREFLRRIFGKR